MSLDNPDTPTVTVVTVETPEVPAAPEVPENTPVIVASPSDNSVALTDALNRIGELETSLNSIREDNRVLWERVNAIPAQIVEQIQPVLEEPEPEPEIIETEITKEIIPDAADDDGDGTPNEVVEIRSTRKSRFI